MTTQPDQNKVGGCATKKTRQAGKDRQYAAYSSRVDPEDVLKAFLEFPQCREGLHVSQMLSLVDENPNQFPLMTVILAGRPKKNRARVIARALDTIIDRDGDWKPRLSSKEVQLRYKPRKHIKRTQNKRIYKDPQFIEIPYIVYTANQRDSP